MISILIVHKIDLFAAQLHHQLRFNNYELEIKLEIILKSVKYINTDTYNGSRISPQ